MIWILDGINMEVGFMHECILLIGDENEGWKSCKSKNKNGRKEVNII